jgi:hypothetical protein
LLDEPAEDYEILPATTPFAAISRITFRGRTVTDTNRQEILGAIARLQSMTTAQKEKLVLDPTMIEDYALWRMLLFWKGKDGFPTIDLFEDEFRNEFVLNWYDSTTNRKQLDWIKRDFPNWRTRLLKGDYAAFREDVQAYIAVQRQKKQQNSKSQQYNFREIPYGATPAKQLSNQEIAEIFGRNDTDDDTNTT